MWAVSMIMQSLTIYFQYLCMLIMRKFIFLEKETEEQKKIFRRVSILLGINDVILAPAVTVILALIPPEEGAYPVIGMCFFLYDIFFNFGVLLGKVIIPLRSVICRRKNRWLGLFIFFPLMGFTYQLQSITLLPSYLFASTEETDMIFSVIAQIVFYLFIAALPIVMKISPEWYKTLCSDIESRSLSLFEEIAVLAVGIWQYFMGYYINNSKVLQNNENTALLAVVKLSCFVISVIVISLVIVTNRRKFYYEQTMSLQKNLITVMADMVESRDMNTGGHIHRTALYTDVIARQLQEDGVYPDLLTDKYIDDMLIAAPLHDIGKVSIPDAVLNKPGRLDENEFRMMKAHSMNGAVIIDRVENAVGDIAYLVIAKEMAEYHHEWWNGKGYPNGISGEDIPICARILAVADVFDALVSKRVYKEPMPVDKAYAIIREESGTHFDPVVVIAFFEAKKQIEKILYSSEEQNIT